MGTPRSHGRQRGHKQHASASSSTSLSSTTATGPAALERPHRPSMATERPGRGRRLPSRLPVRLPAGAPAAAAEHDADRELLTFNVRLAKNRQALLDTNRIERKAFREHARIENAAAAYARELGALLDERGFTRGITLSQAPAEGEAALIVQLSDLHFNERVDLPSNRYDFSVASARLVKLAARVKQIGRCYGVRKVVVACLGDFLNSDRRLDELLSNATNRSKATLLAVDILRA
ncbi:MAG: hypothetical protein ACK55D_01540, partial [Synechococcaceae cyanobacterium]